MGPRLRQSRHLPLRAGEVLEALRVCHLGLHGFGAGGVPQSKDRDSASWQESAGGTRVAVTRAGGQSEAGLCDHCRSWDRGLAAPNGSTSLMVCW